MADAGHYQGQGGTRQGLYVVTPGGERLVSCNTHDAAHVAELLQQALATWAELPADRRRPAPAASYMPTHRWESSRPRDGLVLVSTNRDLSDPPSLAAAQHTPWNRDHVWFTRAEARQWLPADPRAGATHAVPRPLLDRLVCFHLVDNVRGQTLPFAPAEITAAELAVTVVRRDDQRVHLTLTGHTAAETQGQWKLGEIHWKPGTAYPRGMSTTLAGRAVFDLASGRFAAFDMIALGRRWGFTGNNGRRDDPGPAPIGFAFQLAPDTRASEVAPTFIDLYRVEWVQ